MEDDVEMLDPDKATEPADTERASSVVTVWFAIVSASATPIPAEVAPYAPAVALVVADAFWAAVAASAPLSASAPDPIRVRVVTFDRVTATAGVSATLPPAAPIRASVVAASTAVTDSVRLRAPVSTPPSPTSANVLSVIRFSATDAPNPRSPVLVTPAPAGSADTVEESRDAAVIDASPEAPLRATEPSIAARTVCVIAAIATDPATDTLPPPAPATERAPKVDVPSPAAVVSARSVSPLASMLTPAGTTASVRTVADVSATAAPIVASAPCDADPSAALAPSTSPCAASVIVSVAPRWMPGLSTTPVSAVTRVSATAAATFTPPCEVEALGVAAAPDPPPCGAATASA